MKVPGNFRSRERKFLGTFVPERKGSHWEPLLRGTKILGSEKSLNPLYIVGNVSPNTTRTHTFRLFLFTNCSYPVLHDKVNVSYSYTQYLLLFYCTTHYHILVKSGTRRSRSVSEIIPSPNRHRTTKRRGCPYVFLFPFRL